MNEVVRNNPNRFPMGYMHELNTSLMLLKWCEDYIFEELHRMNI